MWTKVKFSCLLLLAVCAQAVADWGEDKVVHVPVYRGAIIPAQACLSEKGVFFTAWRPDEKSKCKSPQSGYGLYWVETKTEAQQVSEISCIRSLQCLKNGRVFAEVEPRDEKSLAQWFVYSSGSKGLVSVAEGAAEIEKHWPRSKAALYRFSQKEKETQALHKLPVLSFGYKSGSQNSLWSMWVSKADRKGLWWVQGGKDDELSTLPSVLKVLKPADPIIYFSSNKEAAYILTNSESKPFAQEKKSTEKPIHALKVINPKDGSLVREFERLPELTEGALSPFIGTIHSVLALPWRGAIFYEPVVPFARAPRLWWHPNANQEELKRAPIPARDFIAAQSSGGGLLLSRRAGLDWYGPEASKPAQLAVKELPPGSGNCTHYRWEEMEAKGDGTHELWHLQQAKSGEWEWIRLARLFGFSSARCNKDSVTVLSKAASPYMAPSHSTKKLAQWSDKEPGATNVLSALDFKAKKQPDLIVEDSGDTLVFSWHHSVLTLVRKPIGDAQFERVVSIKDDESSVRVEQGYQKEKRPYAYDVRVNPGEGVISYIKGDDSEN